MPSLTTTIEEYSPLITFSNGWRAGLSYSDNQTSKYSDSSYMGTNILGSSASMIFNGTFIQIFGAKGRNHGQYEVKINDAKSSSLNGNGPESYQKELFSINLTMDRYEVTITNRGKYLDIDYITWTTEIEGKSDKIYLSTFQDNDMSFTYSSSNDWKVNFDNAARFLGGTGHTTDVLGASVTYRFQVGIISVAGIVYRAFTPLVEFKKGEAVSLYGPIGPFNAPYTVKLDGGLPVNFTSKKALYKAQVLLYHASNLGSGRHSLQVTCQGSGQNFAIDYANVYSTTPPRDADRSGFSTGSIVGITVSSVVGAIGALVCFYFFFLHRRRHAETMANNTDKHSDATGTRSRENIRTPTPFTSLVPTGFSHAVSKADKYQVQFPDSQREGGSMGNNLYPSSISLMNPATTSSMPRSSQTIHRETENGRTVDAARNSSSASDGVSSRGQILGTHEDAPGPFRGHEEANLTNRYTLGGERGNGDATLLPDYAQATQSHIM